MAKPKKAAKKSSKKAAPKKAAPKKALKMCQRRKAKRVVLKKGYKYGKNGACIKVSKKKGKK